MPKGSEDDLAIGPLETVNTDIKADESLLEKFTRLGYDLDTREISIEGPIEPELGPWFRKTMTELERRSDDTITIHLNTNGGDVFAMYQYYDKVIASRCPVHVVAYGEVASAGVLMLACGTKRFVTENTVLMAHEFSGYGGGDLKHRESRDRRKLDDWLMKQWAKLMARHTPYDAKHWTKLVEKNGEFWLLGGREIVEYGVADEIWQPYSQLKDKFPDSQFVDEDEEKE